MAVINGPKEIEKMRVLYCIDKLSGAFPYGSAPSFRAFNLSKLISDAGISVIVLAPDCNLKQEGGYIRQQWPLIQIRTVKEYENNYELAITSIIREDNIDLLFRPSSIRNYKLTSRIAKKYGIPVVLDSVEWFDTTNWRLGKFDPRYYYLQYLWKFKFNKSNGIIAISRLIENHFRNTNNNVYRIPTITDVKNTTYRTEIENESVRFIFSGKLDEGKDNFDTFIEALDIVDQLGEKTRLDIYGPNIEEVKKHLGEKTELLDQHKNNIFIHGRVPQQEAQSACLNSDFSVFFRLNRRSANAGFPTKLGECMTFGTPVICNDTGDISLVVKDKENGFLLNSKSVDEICETLRYLLNMKREDREKMRRKARMSAEKFFDYHNYLSDIQKVFENALERK